MNDLPPGKGGPGSWSSRAILLPWRVRSLPRWVEVLPGLILVASAVLKPLKPNYLCGPDPWEAANAVLFPVEVVLGAFLLQGRRVAVPGLPSDSLRALMAVAEERKRADRRRLGGLCGALLFLGALGVLAFVELFGERLRLRAAGHPCGCFGPVELPFPAHAAVLLLLVGCLGAVFLHEETRLREGGSDTGGPATGFPGGVTLPPPEAGGTGTGVATPG